MNVVLRLLTVFTLGGWFVAPLASAQVVSDKKIRPGKEKIVLALPEAERWRRQEIEKDVPSIRAWSYWPTRGDTAEHIVTSLETSTIDRRYYPVSARGTLSDRLMLVQGTDPGARLEILRERTHESTDDPIRGRRVSILYAIYPSDMSAPDSRVLLILAAEGPTAFHAVEASLLPAAASRETIDKWKTILENSRIE